MLKAFKYRLYPNDQQRKAIDQTIGVCRLVYNLALEVKIRAFQEHGKTISAYELGHEVKFLRSEYEWIKEVNSQSLYASFKNLDNAYKKFFSGGGFPCAVQLNLNK